MSFQEPQTRDPGVFTVSQLNQRARQLLEISFSSVRVEGEISNLARPSSGHWYFTLKDSGAQIRCAMFRSRTSQLKFLPKEGDHVELRGNVSLYENRGDYQLIVDSMKPAGEGALLLAFQQLKNRLAAEGLFDPARKRPLPVIKRIGLVTSPTGAAVHDMLTVLKRRWPAMEVDIYPTPVQGREATQQIVDAIGRANRDNRVDAIIVGRGGGSLEDLWCFNEEIVARAIAASQLPVISAVGHEVDITIADFAADVRAPTPSAAAELVSPDQQDVIQRLQQMQRRLAQSMRQHLQRQQQRILRLQQRVRGPQHQLRNQAQRIDQLEVRLQRAMRQRLRDQQQRLGRLQQALNHQHPQRNLTEYQQRLQRLWLQLQRRMQTNLQQQGQRLQSQAKLLSSLSPLEVLGRGYSITQRADGQVIEKHTDVKIDDIMHTRLGSGWIESQVLSRRKTLKKSPPTKK
ncbi:exodeoxyribonuclease VII large subunit [Thalassolituus oleivorans]|uniref:exodeoxyribonuclease VII large subunit n=1 Tax=Thalassolituus oleivorans TaxID=187493 RepID=UPI00042DB94E|nr:exodeoxyribonuclease VII large subunit [Thalassolituus oleivorans]AHK16214.1 exodeoxyribonuclease VII large subunit [Thalassolituus oleivorans R6-15]